MQHALQRHSSWTYGAPSRGCTQAHARCTPRLQSAAAHASGSSVDADASAAAASSTTTTALQLHKQLQFQGLLGDMSGQWQPQQPPGYPADTAEQQGVTQGSSSSSTKSKPRGFGVRPQQQQQQAAVNPQAECPCKSGLQYQACCHPFLSGRQHPQSAPELARARITAALIGDVAFLVSSTHPNSSLTLGGSRDLMRKTRSQAAVFRQFKPAVVGMAHCRGDTDDTWYVAAVFQATEGPLKGTKAPLFYLMGKRGTDSSSSSNNGSSSSRSSNGSGGGSNGSSSRSKTSARDWLYLAQVQQPPQHADAEPLWHLLQLHVPEMLSEPAGSSSGSSDGSSGSSEQGGGMRLGEIYFVWDTPALNLPCAPEAAARTAAAAGSSRGSSGSSGSNGGWYLDLLQQSSVEAVDRGAGSAAGAAGRSPQAGVVSMDAVIQAMQWQQQ